MERKKYGMKFGKYGGKISIQAITLGLLCLFGLIRLLEVGVIRVIRVMRVIRVIKIIRGYGY